MKALILTFCLLAFLPFSLAHELSLKQAKENLRKAEAEEKKWKSKMEVACRRGIYQSAGSKRQSSMRMYRREANAQNRWGSTCRKSNDPTIVSVRNNLNNIRQRISNLQKETLVGQRYTTAQQQWDSASQAHLRQNTPHLIDTKEGRVLLEKLQFAKEEWFTLGAGLNQQRLKAWAELYGMEDGACGKDTTDPNVYRAYKAYQDIKTSCKTAEEEYFTSGLKVLNAKGELKGVETTDTHMHFEEQDDGRLTGTVHGSSGATR